MGRGIPLPAFIGGNRNAWKMIENTKDLNMVADRLRARGEISRLQELCKEWLIPEKDMQDFLQGKRLRLAEVPLEEKNFSTASEKIAEEMYQFEGPGWQWL